MGYDYKTWRERHRNRADITGMVTHLTREAVIDDTPKSAVAVLVKILNEKCIKGSTTGSGFIVGDRSAFCFHGTPLFGLAENIRYEERQAGTPGRVRYRGVGLCFDKRYAYSLVHGLLSMREKTEVAKRMLPEAEHWRIVNLGLDNEQAIVDWTHEREWRVPGDFCFDLQVTAVIVNTTADYREFLTSADAKLLQQLTGLTVLRHALA